MVKRIDFSFKFSSSFCIILTSLHVGIFWREVYCIFVQLQARKQAQIKKDKLETLFMFFLSFIVFNSEFVWRFLGRQKFEGSPLFYLALQRKVF